MIRFSNTTEVAAIRWIPNYESTVYCFAWAQTRGLRVLSA